MGVVVGRPRSFDRDAALERALFAFWERGFEQTSLAHLKDTLGIAGPSLYAAFGDKRTLFDEAAARYVAALDQVVGAALAAPTAEAAVEQLLREAAEHYTAEGTPPGCMVRSEPLLAGPRAATRAAIEQRIARGRAEGDVAATADVQGLGSYVDAVLTGMSEQARDGATRAMLLASVSYAMAGWPRAEPQQPRLPVVGQQQ